MRPAEGDANRSHARSRWSGDLDDETRELLERDAAVFMHQALSTPCLDVLEQAAGSFLVAGRGRRYLDFHGNGVHSLGHGAEEVIEAVIEQSRRLAFSPRRFTNLPAIALAEELAARFPGGRARCLLAPSGGGAVEIAVALSQSATGRRGTLCFWDAFHGSSPAMVGIGGEAHFRGSYGGAAGAVHVPPPGVYRDPVTGGAGDPDRAAAEIEYVMERHGDLACLLAEPLRSTTVEVPPPAFWARVRRACDTHGVVLIADEVYLGIGRTGRFTASDTLGLVPDVVVLGKSLGGGVMPQAAVVARPDLNVSGDTSVGHVTHEKSPLGAVAALATLRAVDRLGLAERAEDLGREFGTMLAELARTFPEIGDVRGIGLLWGVELVTDPETRAPDVALSERVLYRCLERGLSFKVSGGNVLTLVPPLTVSRAEITEAVEILEASLRASRANRPPGHPSAFATR